MSYAIVRNEKLTRTQAQGICVHNDRKAKNHTNKNIDVNKTHYNFYIKKNELNYVKEFDKIKKEYNLKGQIRTNSIIMCEMIFTSDQDFFNKIGIERTREYFQESYNFICNYKNLGEQNIISAVVHLDEGTPHMHLIYIPVIHTKDSQNNSIDKVCCRDFWKGRDSYRTLQNKFYEYISEKGFKLQRGLPKEETNRVHYTIQEYKNITNFENTKKKLESIKLEMPKTPNVKEIKKIMINRDEKIQEEIIKPKDKLINELYQNNILLHKELSKQTKVIDEVEKYQKERENILADNQNLHNEVANLEKSYEEKYSELELDFKNRKNKLEEEYDNKFSNVSKYFSNKINHLESENAHLHVLLDKFKETLKKFIHWICKNFTMNNDEETLIRDFEKETGNYIEPEKQLLKEEQEREQEWDLER